MTEDLINRVDTFVTESRTEQWCMLEMKESMYYTFTNDRYTHLAMTFWNWIYDNV